MVLAPQRAKTRGLDMASSRAVRPRRSGTIHPRTQCLSVPGASLHEVSSLRKPRPCTKEGRTTTSAVPIRHEAMSTVTLYAQGALLYEAAFSQIVALAVSRPNWSRGAFLGRRAQPLGTPSGTNGHASPAALIGLPPGPSSTTLAKLCHGAPVTGAHHASSASLALGAVGRECLDSSR